MGSFNGEEIAVLMMVLAARSSIRAGGGFLPPEAKVTTIDPKTAAIPRGGELLRTLPIVAA